MCVCVCICVCVCVCVSVSVCVFIYCKLPVGCLITMFSAAVKTSLMATDEFVEHPYSLPAENYFVPVPLFMQQVSCNKILSVFF